MSSITRTMKREQQKAQYKRFSRAWNDEKTFQAYMVSSGQATIVEKVIDNQRVKVLVGDGEAQETMVLGRKPTFNMWVKNKQASEAASKVAPSPGKVDVTDTAWDEGG